MIGHIAESMAEEDECPSVTEAKHMPGLNTRNVTRITASSDRLYSYVRVSDV
jgi:hypothetical protein